MRIKTKDDKKKKKKKGVLKGRFFFLYSIFIEFLSLRI